LSNKVGIDFTELGQSHGSKPGGTAQTRQKVQGGGEKQEDLITIGFRVKPKKRQSSKIM